MKEPDPAMFVQPEDSLSAQASRYQQESPVQRHCIPQSPAPRASLPKVLVHLHTRSRSSKSKPQKEMAALVCRMAVLVLVLLERPPPWVAELGRKKAYQFFGLIL